MSDTPRCLAPMAYYEKGWPDADRDPVCWRPKGHESAKHVSRAAWYRAMDRHTRYIARRRAKQREAVLSDPAARVSA